MVWCGVVWCGGSVMLFWCGGAVLLQPRIWLAALASILVISLCGIFGVLIIPIMQKVACTSGVLLHLHLRLLTPEGSK